MSGGGGIIIICGTFGTPITDKKIVVYDAPGSIAIKLDPDSLAPFVAAAHPEWSAEKVARKVARFLDHIDRSYEEWGEEAEDLGIPYTRHTPHAQP